MAPSSWYMKKAALVEAPDVRIYVVDVGVESAKNASLGELEIQRFVLRPGEPLHLLPR